MRGESVDRRRIREGEHQVWTLTHFLANVGISVDQINGAHPDWLNRFVMRLKECELAVDFHGRTFAPTNTNLALRNALTRGWGHNPSGAGPRLATGQEIETDATAYRRIANELINGARALPTGGKSSSNPGSRHSGRFFGFPKFHGPGSNRNSDRDLLQRQTRRAGRSTLASPSLFAF